MLLINAPKHGKILIIDDELTWFDKNIAIWKFWWKYLIAWYSIRIA